jgi:hypothetical protein
MLTKRASCNIFFFISKSAYINAALLQMGCTGYLDHLFVKSEIKEKNNKTF